MSEQRSVFLSVRPEYAEAILSGAKHVELRRRPPRVEAGALVLLYATAPVCAVVGAFVIDALEKDDPSRLWKKVGAVSGVSRGDFMRYFRQLEIASALRVGATWRLDEPISLGLLRAKWANFYPPQSYRYLSTARDRDTLSVRIAAGPQLDMRLAGLNASAGKHARADDRG